jgi:hypothetical protein
MVALDSTEPPSEIRTTFSAGTCAALSANEPEDVRGTDVLGILRDDGKERLQVVRVGAHGVGTRPTSSEVQELVDEFVPDYIDCVCQAAAGGRTHAISNV